MSQSLDKSEIESDISGFVSTIFMSDDAAGYDDEPQQALPVSDIGSKSLDRDVWDMMQVIELRAIAKIFNVQAQFMYTVAMLTFLLVPGSEPPSLDKSRGLQDALLDRCTLNKLSYPCFLCHLFYVLAHL